MSVTDYERALLTIGNLTGCCDVFGLVQCSAYKEQFEAASKTARELQAQLDEVSQLQLAISEAHDVQVSSFNTSGLMMYELCLCHRGSVLFIQHINAEITFQLNVDFIG